MINIHLHLRFPLSISLSPTYLDESALVECLERSADHDVHSRTWSPQHRCCELHPLARGARGGHCSRNCLAAGRRGYWCCYPPWSSGVAGSSPPSVVEQDVCVWKRPGSRRRHFAARALVPAAPPARAGRRAVPSCGTVFALSKPVRSARTRTPRWCCGSGRWLAGTVAAAGVRPRGMRGLLRHRIDPEPSVAGRHATRTAAAGARPREPVRTRCAAPHPH